MVWVVWTRNYWAIRMERLVWPVRVVILSQRMVRMVWAVWMVIALRVERMVRTVWMVITLRVERMVRAERPQRMVGVERCQDSRQWYRQ